MASKSHASASRVVVGVQCAGWNCSPGAQLRTAWPPQSVRRQRRTNPPGALRPGRSGSHVAVVVRVHGGTSQAMLERHIFWAASMAGSHTGNFRLLILADETHDLNRETRRRVQQLAANAGLGDRTIVYSGYTEADMATAFPVMAELRASVPNTQDVIDAFSLPCRKSLAWGFHVEAILLWWARTCGTSEEPSAVWIVEDDAGYSGDLVAFLRSMECEGSKVRNADLVTHGLRRVEESWVWRDTGSPAFLQLAPRTRRLRCAEHLQRMSARLLRALHDYCLQGVSAWSEMSVPTLCSLAGLRLEALPAEHIGMVFAFDGKVPPTAWPRLCASAATKNKWWHALKW